MPHSQGSRRHVPSKESVSYLEGFVILVLAEGERVCADEAALEEDDDQ